MEPWLKDFDWGDDALAKGTGAGHTFDSIGELPSAQTFEKTLTESKRMCAKAASLIEDYKQRTPR